MTGEITLRGKVLPVGCIKEKVLAAHRAGIRTMIQPRRNEADPEDVRAVLQGLRHHVTEGEWQDVRSGMPDDRAPLLQ